MRISDWSSDVCSSDLVGERLQQDVAVIVVRRLEAGEMRLDTVDRHREAADPVAVGADEIGEAHIGTALALGDLLAQEGDADVACLFLAVDDEVIALPPALTDDRAALRVTPCLPATADAHRPHVWQTAARPA